jgi:hypothetical protein
MGIVSCDAVAWKRLKSIHSSMKTRCTNRKAINYRDYGAKGISVCPEWRTLVVFAEWALANGYANHLTIERIDSTGNYCPQNCRWATMAEQNRNKANNRVLDAFGEKKIMQDWAADPRCLVTFGGLRRRLATGWEDEAAIGTPPANKGRRR